MGKIRCAIIGCGPSTEGKGGCHSVSYAHGWAYEKHLETQLIAAASRKKENIDDFGDEFPGIQKYQNYKEMLVAEKPEMVSVCAFPGDREEMVLEAVRAGAKVVWAEKPFALSVASAKKMVDEAAKEGARIYVNHQRRYGKPFEYAKALIERGKIGNILSVDITQPFKEIINFGPHLVDAALNLIGSKCITHVFGAVDMTSSSEYQGIRTENQFLVCARFDGGGRLLIEAGDVVSEKLPVIRVNGSDGFVELHLDNAEGCPSILRAALKNEDGIFSPELPEHFHFAKDCPNAYYDRALIDIVASWKSQTPSRIDATEAIRGLEIIWGGYESARQGRILKL